MRANQATAEVFFTAFRTLGIKEKEAFLEKVINDPELREDLIDIALIEEAKKNKRQINLRQRIFFKTTQCWKSCLSSYLVKLMSQAQKNLDGFSGKLLSRFEEIILGLYDEPRPHNSKKLSGGGSRWRIRAAEEKTGHLSMDTKIAGGQPVIKGTRIKALEVAVRYELMGISPDWKVKTSNSLDLRRTQR